MGEQTARDTAPTYSMRNEWTKVNLSRRNSARTCSARIAVFSRWTRPISHAIDPIPRRMRQFPHDSARVVDRGDAMTEAEWLACGDHVTLLTYLRGKATARKLRLLAVAGVQPVAFRISAPEYLEAIRFAEDWAEGNGDASVFERRYHELYSAYCQDHRSPHDSLAMKASFAAIYCLEPDPRGAASSAPFFACRATTPFEQLTSRTIASLLRDIFGNPFRPVSFDPAWRTSTVLSLASQMYESRDFGAMPILADALQDAGCASEDILDHCRDAKQVHVRGCWVVDLVLSKE
jgi:hypothetical protein